MKSFPRIRVILLICFAVTTEHTQALNYGKLKFINFARAAVSPLDPKPEIVTKNETVKEPKPVLSNPSPRKFRESYSIIYPLTFTPNRGGKSLNLTFPPETPPAEEVQSRIMNSPQPYPNFAFETDSKKYDKPQEPAVVPNPPQSSSDEYDDSQSPRFPPQQPVPYRPKDSQYIPPPASYRPKDSQYLLPPPPPPPPQRYDKGLDFFSFQQQQIPNTTRPTSSPAPNSKDKLNYVIPSLGYNKNLRVPKPKPPPLQAYNKATVVATAPLSPVSSPYKVQQWSSCFCVPYYLCKNGVLNSGGRLQTVQRRKSRSLKYSYGNKTLPTFTGPSKIVNIYANERTPNQNVCEPGKVCCQLSFADNVDDEDDGNYYPVATPAPEPSYPLPPRFPNTGKDYKVCGVRPVYGVQTRLKQLQYTADVAEFGEYPWQVAILKKVVGDKNLYLCGGVLISPQWVATVAHCVKKDKSSPLLIRLGEWDVNRKDEMYPYIEKDVTVIVVHPDFNPESLENDLALIKMQDPVDPRIPHITPACPPRPGQIYDDEKCWVSGWGKDFFGSQGEYQNVLKEVDVPVVSRALCNTELRSTNLGPNFVLHPGFLCAGGEAGKDACTGDGGSPLVCKSEGLWYVVGLVSWGIGCGQPGVPGVYVNVLYYIDWINSITRR